MADAPALGAGIRKDVEVQVLSPAPVNYMPISNKFIKYSQWLVVVGSLLALIVSIIIIKNKYNSNYLVINNNKINIDIANNDTKIISGLSNIKNIKNNYGMLFDFPNYGEPTFWNKDMLFAIDVVWLKDNLVVGIDSLPAVANGLKSITPQ